MPGAYVRISSDGKSSGVNLNVSVTDTPSSSLRCQTCGLNPLPIVLLGLRPTNSRMRPGEFDSRVSGTRKPHAPARFSCTALLWIKRAAENLLMHHTGIVSSVYAMQ